MTDKVFFRSESEANVKKTAPPPEIVRETVMTKTVDDGEEITKVAGASQTNFG